MRWLIALVLVVGVGSALPAQGAPRKSMTIRLVSITTQESVLTDAAPAGKLGTGDVFWAKSTLRNEVPQFGKPKGAVVGSDVSTYTIVSATKSDMTTTVKLPGGTLWVTGRVGQERLQRITVLGGTGTFAGARGVAEISPLDARGDNSRNVYRLRLP